MERRSEERKREEEEDRRRGQMRTEEMSRAEEESQGVPRVSACVPASLNGPSHGWRLTATLLDVNTK